MERIPHDPSIYSHPHLPTPEPADLGTERPTRHYQSDIRSPWVRGEAGGTVEPRGRRPGDNRKDPLEKDGVSSPQIPFLHRPLRPPPFDLPGLTLPPRSRGRVGENRPSHTRRQGRSRRPRTPRRRTAPSRDPGTALRKAEVESVDNSRTFYSLRKTSPTSTG